MSLLLSSDVLFDIGQSALRPDAQDTLGAAVAQIDAAGATSVTVAGHTDNTGTVAINGPLSQARATAVEADPAPSWTSPFRERPAVPGCPTAEIDKDVAAGVPDC